MSPTPFALDIPPLFTRLAQSKRVLIAGAGGGFDVFAGLPLFFALRARDKQVFLANLTESMFDVSARIEAFRHRIETRRRRSIPH